MNNYAQNHLNTANEFHCVFNILVQQHGVTEMINFKLIFLVYSLMF